MSYANILTIKSNKYIEKYVFRTYNDVRKLLLYILLKDTACRYRKGII